MKRILFGLVLIVGASAVIAGGATGAFFSDTEASTGNSFTAGAIDLKIDNDSYYNGNRCTNTGTLEQPNFVWQGLAPFPVPGTPCDTSFALDDLDNGRLFFNFNDLKPDDEGEDTISLHVQNDAWACMDMTLTSNDDKSSTEPELEDGDDPEDGNDTWDGELAQNLQFFWWADDGDNVYEDNENSLSDGVQTLYNLAKSSGPFSVTLADMDENAWGDDGPLPANETVYIAKAWCFGTLTPAAVPAGQGVSPSVNPGVTCDGTALDNLTQTDGATLDVAFRAIQARHNPNFRCEGPGEEPRTAKINVIKKVINNNGGNNTISDFQLFIDNGTTATNMTSGATTTVLADTYVVDESGGTGYVRSFSGDCDANGNITLNPGDEKFCVITNDDLEAHITIVKNVINNNGGTATENSAWGFTVNGVSISNNTSMATTSNTNLFINEAGRAGYHFVSITGAGCPSATSTPIVLNEGESITCTITNDDNPGLNDNFGTSGTCVQDIPGWDEDPGDTCVNGTVSKNPSVSGDDSVSPDGGNFALIGNNGYICHSVNASGLQNLQLKYYWRGDTAGDAGSDFGLVQVYTGGTCASPTGTVLLASHDVSVTSWSALQTVALPDSFDNTSFFVRFAASTNGGTESFRVDGITLTGSPI